MKDSIMKQIYATTIGGLVLEFLETEEPDVTAAVQSDLKDLISGIKTILDDETLEDPECFQRIEAIVELYHQAGIDTTRHDWG